MNSRKSPRYARKAPQQARSQATVEVILEGAIRVLDTEGAEAATTSRIAEVAGVSVGTLYQYFSNKEAILDALQDREFERAAEMLGSSLQQSGFESERDLAQAIVGGLLEMYRRSPGLHRLLASDGLRLAPTERVQDFDRKLVDSLRAFFEMTTFRVTRKNKHAAAFVLYQSVRATLLAAILEEPPGITDEILVEEVTDMIVGHLVGPEES